MKRIFLSGEENFMATLSYLIHILPVSKMSPAAMKFYDSFLNCLSFLPLSVSLKYFCTSVDLEVFLATDHLLHSEGALR